MDECQMRKGESRPQQTLIEPSKQASLVWKLPYLAPGLSQDHGMFAWRQSVLRLSLPLRARGKFTAKVIIHSTDRWRQAFRDSKSDTNRRRRARA